MEIQYWPIDPELKKEAEDNYRTKFALGLKEKSPIEIIRELTFDGAAPDITVEAIEDLLDFIERKLLKRRFRGTGIEVGAGPLVFSSILARRNEVQKVYGIEICHSIIENLFPKIAQISNNKEKLVGVVGSFDEMKLQDSSVDFIFDFYSLHHSQDVNLTMKELFRVLKPGGFLICLDKARPDSFTQEDLNGLMDKDYEQGYKKQFGLPLDQVLTRRMNGETEHRLKDWKKYIENAGFKKNEYYYLEKIAGSKISVLIKNFISMIPTDIQKNLTSLLPEPRRNHKFILESKNRIFTKYLNPFRKETSLIIAYK